MDGQIEKMTQHGLIELCNTVIHRSELGYKVEMTGSNPAGGTLAIPFTPLCQCLLEKALNADGLFCLVSMPGKVKYPTQGVNV